MPTELIIFGIIASPLAFVALRHWRLVVWCVLFLLVFEGAIRKWVLPGLQAQVYLAKDGMLLLAYVGYIFYGPPRRRASAAESAIKLMMGACVLFYLVQIFNPYSPSLLLGLLGFKNYVFYFPLVFLAANMFTSRNDMVAKMRRYAWVMIPVSVLGLVQFSVGPTHWLNAYVSHDEGTITIVSRFGGEIERARTAGTFSYLSGYVTFLTTMCLMTLGLIIGSGVKVRGYLPIYFLLATSAAAMFTTGSRIGVMAVAAGMPLMLLLAFSRREISAAIAFRGVMGIAAMSIGAFLVAGDAFDAFADRTTRVEDATVRFLSPFEETAGALSTSPFLGLGLASTHGGFARTVVDADTDFYWLGGNLYEVELARVMQETGVIGFTLNYGLRLLCLIFAIRMAFRSRDRLFSAMSSGIACFFALHMILYLVGNPTAAIYYWFGVGILLAMRHLDLQQSVYASGWGPGMLRPTHLAGVRSMGHYAR